MTYFKAEEDFWKAFRQFNFLYGSLFEWKQTTARKEHDDMFGVCIEARQTYFRKDVGNYGYDSVEKLSMSSMEKLVYVVIGLNPALGTHLQNRLEQESKDLADRLG